MKRVYITSTGSFLPGEPVSNESIEDHLGLINKKKSRSKRRILESNQIKTRHYAIDSKGNTTTNNAKMAARAISTAIEDSSVELKDLELICAGTTLGDLLVPGHASMVHGELGGPTCEISTSHGVCASSLMAIKNAFLQVQTGEKKNAVACGSEFVSRAFRGSRFSKQTKILEEGVSFDTDFLRWMLSDGAGAVVLQDKPAPTGVSYEIEWIDIRSHANHYDVCMYAGGEKNRNTGEVDRFWLEQDSDQLASDMGLINLKQDIKMLDDIVKVGVKHLVDLIEQGRVNTDSLKWYLCHYSSHFFKPKIQNFFERAGIRIPEEKWFTNLYTKGNTGAASIFIMLDELHKENLANAGDPILCMVPESGRFISGYMMLKAVQNGVTNRSVNRSAIEIKEKDQDHKIRSLKFSETTDPQREKLFRQLSSTWIDFESRLQNVPIILKMRRGQFCAEDYRTLLRNLRPQVIEGNTWISRIASSFEKEHFSARAYALKHAMYGHADYQQLDRGYVAAGGSLEEIQNSKRNIGTEALNAYMLQKSSETNPFDMLGAMFVIEGLSSRVCAHWKKLLEMQLSLPEEAYEFLSHHAQHEDSDITGPIDELLQGIELEESRIESIVKTARTTARLYLLQLEEIDVC